MTMERAAPSRSGMDPVAQVIEKVGYEIETPFVRPRAKTSILL